MKSTYQRLIDEHVASFLAGLGFERKRRVYFEKWDGDRYMEVSLQLVKAKGRDEGAVAVWVGLGFRTLAEFLASVPARRFRVDASHPIAMATNVGHLGPTRNWTEWPLFANSNLEPIGREITEQLGRYALPLFDRFSTLEKAVMEWEAGLQLNVRMEYVVGAYLLLGRQQSGMNCISRVTQELRRRSEQGGRGPDRDMLIDWEAFAESLGSRMRLQPGCKGSGAP